MQPTNPNHMLVFKIKNQLRNTSILKDFYSDVINGEAKKTLSLISKRYAREGKRLRSEIDSYKKKVNSYKKGIKNPNKKQESTIKIQESTIKEIERIYNKIYSSVPTSSVPTASAPIPAETKEEADARKDLETFVEDAIKLKDIIKNPTLKGSTFIQKAIKNFKNKHGFSTTDDEYQMLCDLFKNVDNQLNKELDEQAIDLGKFLLEQGIITKPDKPKSDSDDESSDVDSDADEPGLVRDEKTIANAEQELEVLVKDYKNLKTKMDNETATDEDLIGFANNYYSDGVYNNLSLVGETNTNYATGLRALDLIDRIKIAEANASDEDSEVEADISEVETSSDEDSGDEADDLSTGGKLYVETSKYAPTKEELLLQLSSLKKPTKSISPKSAPVLSKKQLFESDIKRAVQMMPPEARQKASKELDEKIEARRKASQQILLTPQPTKEEAALGALKTLLVRLRALPPEKLEPGILEKLAAQISKLMGYDTTDSGSSSPSSPSSSSPEPSSPESTTP